MGGVYKSEKKAKSSHPIIIKTSPISPLSGKGIIEVEREVTDYMSIQVGLGLTFKSLLNISLVNVLNDDSEEFHESTLWEYDITDDFNDFTIRKVKPGFVFSISPRFFYESDGFEGSYIAPVFRYSTYNYSVKPILEIPGEIIREASYSTDESVKNIDLLVHYGTQVLYPKLTTEYFIGLGARLETANRQDLGIDSSGVNRNGIAEIKKTTFLLEGGVRIGFQL
ncbi:MAG TPA: hypothetical protein PKC06_17050 [Saprospiraceae bacterium]|jgi:hypothetical protein|nr:hypothetical protein [Saprospiraceae bacterium]